MKRSRGRGTLALGIMSGTSADGIDVALVRMTGRKASLENFAAFPFPSRVQKAILKLGEGRPVTTGEISQLNFLLGELFADAALAACKKFRVAPAQIDVIGSHGQTVFHQGVPSLFNGQPGCLDIANRRAFGDCGADWDHHGGRFSSRGHGRGRARRAARALRRFPAVSAPADRARRAEYRRDRQRHGDSRGREARRCFCIRYRAGEYGDRCPGAAFHAMAGKDSIATRRWLAKGKLLPGLLQTLLRDKYFLENSAENGGTRAVRRKILARPACPTARHGRQSPKM